MGLTQGGGAHVLKVLIRVGVPGWDHRGTQELVVAVHGSPPSPADGPSGWLHNVTPPSLCHVGRQGEPLPRAAYCESRHLRNAVQGRHGQQRQKASRSKGWRGSLALFLFPLTQGSVRFGVERGLGEAAWVCKLPAAPWRKMLLEPRAAIWLVLAIWVQSLQECRRHCQERKEQPQHAKRGLLNASQISSGHREATPKGHARHVLLFPIESQDSSPGLTG